jgi:hypothetical protein
VGEKSQNEPKSNYKTGNAAGLLDGTSFIFSDVPGRRDYDIRGGVVWRAAVQLWRVSLRWFGR